MNGTPLFPLGRLALLASTLIVVASPVARAQAGAIDAFEQNRKLGRGVNILGYDPIWR